MLGTIINEIYMYLFSNWLITVEDKIFELEKKYSTKGRPILKLEEKNVNNIFILIVHFYYEKKIENGNNTVLDIMWNVTLLLVFFIKFTM